MRGNSFTLVRLGLALAVVFSHAFVLGGFGPDPLQRWTGPRMNIGSLAVVGFFVISGFLLSQSLERHPSIRRFCIHRLARILPGFWMTLLFSTLVLAPALIRAEAGGAMSYAAALSTGPHSAIDYLAGNWTLDVQHFVIGPVFAHNAGGNGFNGSLWTLYHEGLCYAGLLVLWIARGLRPLFTLLLWFVVFTMQALDFFDHASFVLASPALSIGAKFLFSSLTRALYLGFLSGMVLNHWRLHEKASPRWFWAALAVFAGSLVGGFAPVVWPVTLPFIVIWLAHRRTAWDCDRFGDWSYGVYLYAFPLQQCLALAGLQQHGLTLFILCSFAASLAAGAASWHLVESPVLRLARGWVKETPAGSAEVTRTAALPLPAQ